MIRDWDNHPYDVWIATYDDGNAHLVYPGDLWSVHKNDIEGALRDRGVKVIEKVADFRRKP